MIDIRRCGLISKKSQSRQKVFFPMSEEAIQFQRTLDLREKVLFSFKEDSIDGDSYQNSEQTKKLQWLCSDENSVKVHFLKKIFQLKPWGFFAFFYEIDLCFNTGAAEGDKRFYLAVVLH